jgi:uncharacterized protein YjbI with pentapeptide repeats
MSLWKHLWAAFVRLGIAGLVIAFIAFVIFIGVVYYTGVFPDWTGFGPPLLDAQGKELPHEKTLWDWMGLLLIPLVLAIGGYFLTRSENRYALDLQERREKEAQKLEDQRIQEARKIEEQRIEEARKLEEQRTQEARRIEEQRAQDAALQAYLDQMTQLLLHEELRTSKPDNEVRSVARARTLTVLRVLDSVRKATVLQFLYEAGLIGGIELEEGGVTRTIDPIVSLEGTNLNGAHLQRANLNRANLNGAFLSEVFLYGANLYGANLGGANLFEANLGGANLFVANLEGANLFVANLEGANLGGANLEGTNLNFAHLQRANLSEANLSEANLEGANLEGADLRGAYLDRADLTNCKITRVQLAQAASLEAAKLPFDMTLPPAPGVEVAAQEDQVKK